MTAASCIDARIVIPLGERAYEILIGAGLLDDPAAFAGLPRAAAALIVSNTRVAPLYAQRLQRTLAASYPTVHLLTLPDGEAHKDWSTLNQVFDALLAGGFDRRTVLFALGGGVIGDLTGFAAPVRLQLGEMKLSIGAHTAFTGPAPASRLAMGRPPRGTAWPSRARPGPHAPSRV